MDMLLTGFQLIVLATCVYAAMRARDYADAADHSNKQLRNAVGRLTAAEASLESLYQQHKKLAGKFYASQPQLPTQREVDETLPDDHLAPPYCPNFHEAQIKGPRSDAAQCPCDYCKEMRARRAATKAELLPRARAATLAEARK